MFNYFLSLALFSLACSFGFNSSKPADQDFGLDKNAAIFVNRDESDELVLDKDEICIPCPPGYRTNEDFDCDINMLITVSADATEDKNSIYQYTVSGGRIIGEGAKVSWDVTGAMPGTYQISVDIRNKINGLQKRKTKTITVDAQTCGGVCVCPTLSVAAPSLLIKAGETITFTANVSGSGETITYDWTISDGKILEGQGTPVIIVATNLKMAGKIVKATVEIGGVCEECSRIESADGLVVKAKRNKK